MTRQPIQTNGLRPLEIATSILVGVEPGTPDPEGSASGAIGAFERALLRALERPPCLVSFSGGRDSSAVLAIAVRVARREGLPEPVPITARFLGAPQTEEAEWQQHVIAHLGVADWERRDFEDELDLIGPVARTLMARAGLPYPSNLHLMFPLLEAARGGTFVTGLGGDETLAPAGRVLDVLARRVGPKPRDLLRVGGAVAPRRLRRSVFRRRGTLSFPWLRPEANAMLGSAWLEDALDDPLRWNARISRWRRSRYMGLALRRIAAMGALADVQCIHPFTDAGFVSALASESGITGFGSRTEAMRALLGDALPPELIGRPTKASFDETLWNRHTRAFVEDLDGDVMATAVAALGLDALVDPRALAEHWAAPGPLGNSFLLLQACWLALEGSDHATERRPPVPAVTG